ncbi:DUF892 family protein [Burkholderia contaminans]|uniref:DUF892 family protein n=1 Tax=Burkholderia contaminans TaxID=488447 RepID=UPI00069C19B0|nr:DUF892 family protein [Burkholderia contaminans]MEB4640014.1 DUF892 family protein [Burkholderia contaminans]MEB4654496.1 DUF892 family protein [Burkholderia contaminans]MEB4659040.1 DUF892 family protein [Burkholderia contaminans]MEB4669912.1 DUF892 family protein [Burkholderia contaminans]MEB4682226.1 DUF892 family protein [Burkholderia contaminans]
MANPHEHLEDWLRDAYAMKRQVQTLLGAQLKRLDHYPQLQDRLRHHLPALKTAFLDRSAVDRIDAKR